MSSHLKLSAYVGKRLSDPEVYRRLVGKLIYLTITRPDISFAAQVLSQFMHEPAKKHLATTKHVLRYLKSSPGQGILLCSQSMPTLTGFCDSDWASCGDSRKSPTGFCILLGNSPNS